MDPEGPGSVSFCQQQYTKSKDEFEGDLRLFSCFGAHWGPSRLHTSDPQPFDGQRTCSLQSFAPPLPSPEQPAH